MICDINEATKRVCFMLKDVPKKIEDINEGRYKLLHFSNEIILIAYKRQHFLSFNEHSHGESINVQDLEYAMTKGVKRVFIAYADDRIYVISPHTIKAQATIRTTEYETKDTYSFDIKLLIPMKEFNEVQIC